MAATPRAVVRSGILYRGTTRQASSVYHFNGGFPSGSGPATTFMDAIVTAEKAIRTNAHTINLVSLYPAGSNVASFSKVYSTAGTLAAGTSNGAPADVCCLLRWSTAAVTSKNHPIYLFNYLRGIQLVQQVASDPQIYGAQVTAIDTYAAAWIAGFSDGTNTYVRAGPNGATALSHLTEVYPHHRDFPR